MTDYNECPNCGVSLQGEPIPERNQHWYGDKTHFGRTIGMEVRGVYDGVLYWFCPDCGWAWHRWEEGNRLRTKAQSYIDEARRESKVLGSS